MHAEEKYFELGGKKYNEGDYISLDGSTGKIYGEAVPTVEATISGDFDRFMKWAGRCTHSEGSHECGYAARYCAGSEVRRGGHRPLPHGAHVL